MSTMCRAWRFAVCRCSIVAAVGLFMAAVVSPADAGTLYAVRDSDNFLVSINTDTFVIQGIGQLGPGIGFDFGGLAYDPNAHVLYGIGGGPNRTLFTVNRSTGAATLIGTHNLLDLAGLAFDSKNNRLYATQTFVATDDLFTLNTTTAAPTAIGNIPQTITGLEYDSTNDRLVGVNLEGDLYAIDRTTAAATLLVANPDFTSDAGLAYDSDKNLFWHITGVGSLFSYDPTNNFARTTHLSRINGYTGLAFVPTQTVVPTPSALGIGSVGLAILMLGYRPRSRCSGCM